MPWAATDALDDAREATQSLLLPFDRGRWLRLAIIAFFVGGVGSFGGGGNAGTSTPGNGPGTSLPPGWPDASTVVAIVLALVVLGVLFVLVLAAVGAVMEFVLVEGLRTRDVHIREPFREYLRPGLRLFVFRLVVFLTPVLVVGIPIVVVGVLGFGGAFALLILIIPLLLLGLALGLLAALVDRLTADFVVPAMLAEGHGVLDGWRRLWPELRREWREFVVYIVLRVILGIVVAIAVGLVLLLALVVVAIPFVILGGIVVFATGASGTLFAVAVGLLALGFVLVAIPVVAVVQVPVVTFFRYYSLYVLGLVVPSLDLVGATEEDGDDRPGGRDGGDGPDDGSDAGRERAASDDDDGRTTDAADEAGPADAGTEAAVRGADDDR